MMEAAFGYEWLQTTLSVASVLNAGATKVCADVAEVGTVAPWVVYGLQSSQDSNSASNYRLLTDNLFWVRAVGLKRDRTLLIAIANACDALLQRKQGTTTDGGVILDCIREQELILTQNLDGELWTYAGGLYRLLINTGQ